MAAGEGRCASRLVRKDERRNYFTLATGNVDRAGQALLFPFASVGATDGQIEHSLDEQGMSCLK